MPGRGLSARRCAPPSARPADGPRRTRARLAQLVGLAAAGQRGPQPALQGRRSAPSARPAQDPPLPHDRQARAQLGHVVDDVGGEDDDDVLADLGQQVLEARAARPDRAPPSARRRSAACGLPSSAWAMPNRCFMPPEKVWTLRLRASQRLVRIRSCFDRRGRSAPCRPFRAAGGAAWPAPRCADSCRTPGAGSPGPCAAAVLSRSTSMPSKVMAPESGSCRVAMVRISVDLPAPFGPSRPNMPGGISSETPFSALTPPA